MKSRPKRRKMKNETVFLQDESSTGTTKARQIRMTNNVVPPQKVESHSPLFSWDSFYFLGCCQDLSKRKDNSAIFWISAAFTMPMWTLNVGVVFPRFAMISCSIAMATRRVLDPWRCRFWRSWRLGIRGGTGQVSTLEDVLQMVNISHHSSSFIDIYRHILSFIIILHHSSSLFIIYQHVLSFINIYQRHLSTFISIYQHLSRCSRCLTPFPECFSPHRSSRFPRRPPSVQGFQASARSWSCCWAVVEATCPLT